MEHSHFKGLPLAAVILFARLCAICHAQTLAEALNSNLTWTTGGTVPWEVTTNTTHDGAAAAQSGLLANSQDSWIQTSVTGPSAVTFWWTTTATEWENPLQLYIGGSLQAQVFDAGGVWQQRSFYIPTGPQAVQWKFTTDGIREVGERGLLDEVALSDPVPVSIAIQPTNQVVRAGDPVNLMAALAGTEPLSLSWLKNGNSVASANSPSLTIPSVQAIDAGDYALVAANALGAVTSQVATVTVVASVPVFTLQPIAQGSPPYSSVTFSAAAKGSEPLSWQWYSNGIALAGSVTTNYTIDQVNTSSYADYFVVATNAQGSTTSVVARLSYSPVAAWGDNTYGQNIVPAAATNILSLCGGDYHCLALRTDGEVLGWGQNTWAGEEYDQATVPPEATNVIGITAGSAHSLAIRVDGSIVKWGHIIYSDWQEVPEEATNVAAVALGTGAQHALALRADGTVVEWGSTNYGLLPAPQDLTNVVGVAAGAYHSLALKADGTVVFWGGLGMGFLPHRVPLAATNVVAIAAGWFHNLALRADGTVVAWTISPFGNDPAGNVPAGLSNVIAIACGGDHSLALRRDGTLVSWGIYGQSSVPLWATNLVAIAGTRLGTLALIGDGPPWLCSPLINRSVSSGANAYFYAPAVGALPLSYQWQLNGTNLPGATKACLVVPASKTAVGGAYSVTVTNFFGAVTSPGAVLNATRNPRLVLESPTVINGQLHFNATGQAGLAWAVENSTNLSQWAQVQLLTNLDGTVSFTDSGTNLWQRFYRLRLVP